MHLGQVRTTTDVNLKSSVAEIRERSGCPAGGAVIVSPLWAAGVGSIGALVLGNVPYARAREDRHRLHMRLGPRDGRADASLPKEGTNSKRESTCPFVVGADVMLFAKRVGQSLGTAVDQLRRTVATNIVMEVAEGARECKAVFDNR